MRVADQPSEFAGYVEGSMYPSRFHSYFAPPNVDAMLVHAGVASPRCFASRGPFTMLDIGCGDGVGLILNAVAHPEAHFIGIDGSADHIARGQRIARQIGLSNVDLHCCYFDAAKDHIAPAMADYVQCQGVLAWVNQSNRSHVLDFAAHALKPGGALTIGYNCLPGWLPLIPFQHMLRSIADDAGGPARERFDVALAAMRDCQLIDDATMAWVDEQRALHHPEYFAHEYLNSGWAPLWSGDVIAQLEALGFALIGQARPNRLRDDFALKAAWRAKLDTFTNTYARESASDILTHNWFRMDLYIKCPHVTLGPKHHAAARRKGWWAVTKTTDEMVYEARTSAGIIRFDNPAARAIVAALQSGPQPLSAIAGFRDADIFNAIDALYMATAVVPVDPPAEVPLADTAHATICASGVDVINGKATPYGVLHQGKKA